MSRIEDLYPFGALKSINNRVVNNSMSIGHSDCHLRIVVQSTHAVNALWYFDIFLQFERKLIEYKNPPVTAPNEDTVDCDNRTVHLSVLNIQLSDYAGRIDIVNVNVVALTVD